jgi:gas vesicle protein
MNGAAARAANIGGDEAMEREGHSTALLTGAMLGGLLALLYAPKRGTEIRKLLMSKAELAREEAQELADYARHLVEEKTHDLRPTVLQRHTRTEDGMDKHALKVGFCAGAIIGGLVGMLYAPRPGKETRQLWKNKAEETLEDALAVAEQARDQATERVKKAKAAIVAAKRDAEAGTPQA